MTLRIGSAALALLLTACATRGPGTPSGTPSGEGSLPVDPRCPGAAPGPGARCMQDCGSPAMREEGEPPPPYRWLSAEDAKSRATFGCPICLDATARIATPDGERLVASLRVGDAVFTEDASGGRVVAPLLHVVRVRVAPEHRVVALRLADGRTVRVSPGHPLASGGVVEDLVAGAALDASSVAELSLVAPSTPFTFDLLPAGPTGHYWADGVKLGSTLRGSPPAP